MSKENVVLFSKALARDAALNRRIAAAPRTMEGWLEVAHEAGFEFTGEEFAAVVGETLGRTVTAADAVREYLGAQHAMGSARLNEKVLDGLVGGRGPAPGWILP